MTDIAKTPPVTKQGAVELEESRLDTISGSGSYAGSYTFSVSSGNLPPGVSQSGDGTRNTKL